MAEHFWRWLNGGASWLSLPKREAGGGGAQLELCLQLGGVQDA